MFITYKKVSDQYISLTINIDHLKVRKESIYKISTLYSFANRTFNYCY